MNPFATLGISREALVGLTDEQAWSLVKAMHRALALIHHPDRGGNARRFRGLQQALEALDYDSHPESFAEWKQRLSNRPATRLAESETKRALAEEAHSAVEQVLHDYWLACAGPVAAPEGAFNVFGIPAARILVSEDLVSLFMRRQVSPWVYVPRSHVEFVVAGGALRRFRMKELPASSEDVAALRPEQAAWGYKGSSKRAAYVLRRIDDGEPLRSTRILGGISSHDLSAGETTSRFLAPLLDGMVATGDEVGTIRKGFTWEEFRRYCTAMRPWVAKGDLLVLATAGPTSQFLVAGTIRGIVCE